MFLYVLRARSTQHIFSYESVLKVEVVYMNISRTYQFQIARLWEHLTRCSRGKP
jgi:hypothetical protein